MLKFKEPYNGKSVIPIYGNHSSTLMTIPIRIAKNTNSTTLILYMRKGEMGACS